MIEHFFIAGAQRSGTTLLHGLLHSHPDIEMAMPVRPEPKFFLRDELFCRGLEYYERTFFGDKVGARLRGEKTVSYMESRRAAERIADCYPDSHIVFVLRDPVQRAVSHYRFSVANGVETLSMAAAFEKEADRSVPSTLEQLSMSPWAYVARGRYVEYLTLWEGLFPREQLILLLYEDLIAGPGALMWLLRQLGASSSYVPSLPEHVRRGEAAPPKELLCSLRKQFGESNRELARRWGLDLAPWGVEAD